VGRTGDGREVPNRLRGRAGLVPSPSLRPGDIAFRNANLAEGWFKHLRHYLSRFPGCRNAEHSERALGCFLLAAESAHGGLAVAS
jgi:hypothetical protein